MDERAKISVSLSDDLKARLDAYSQQHNLGVSDVVQQALEAFLNAPPGPPQPQPGHDLELLQRVQQLQEYVSHLAHHEEYVRQSIQFIAEFSAMNGVSVPCPPPLPVPPWLQGYPG